MTERLSIPKCIFQCIFSDFTLLVLTNFSKENKEKNHHKCRGKKQTKYISKILRSVSFTCFCLSPRGSLQVQYVEVTRHFIYNFKSNIFNYLFTFIYFYFCPGAAFKKRTSAASSTLKAVVSRAPPHCSNTQCPCLEMFQGELAA